MSLKSPNSVLIRDARLSFPALENVSEKTGKYGCALLIAKDNDAVDLIEAMCARVLKENDPKNADAIAKRLHQVDKFPLHDGESKEKYAGYAGNYFVNANCTTKPRLFDGKREPVVDGEAIREKFYSGAVVNAIIEIFYYNNKYGRGLGVGLKGLQFVRDADRFDGGAQADADEFPVVEGEAAAAADETPWD